MILPKLRNSAAADPTPLFHQNLPESKLWRFVWDYEITQSLVSSPPHLLPLILPARHQEQRLTSLVYIRSIPLLVRKLEERFMARGQNRFPRVCVRTAITGWATTVVGV